MERRQMHRCWARVKTTFEGFHRYPDAPENVAFLRALHRHMFAVTVWIEQFHESRDVEYITFQRWLRAELPAVPFPEHASCEDMAYAIAERISDRLPGRKLRVEVAEDDENGALIEFGGSAETQLHPVP